MARYLVFGRKDYAEPLRQHGVLEVEGGDPVRQQALRLYGRAWVELVLVPEVDVRWVLRRQETAEEEEEG
ncbi:MAG TPA: hypothetical protein VNL95_10215 [Dehalococcoidia bacterium]|nr:hypothetical protein [Dehalococcoidia bacterium]